MNVGFKGLRSKSIILGVIFLGSDRKICALIEKEWKYCFKGFRFMNALALFHYRIDEFKKIDHTKLVHPRPIP
jgi:hypothetical protein